FARVKLPAPAKPFCPDLEFLPRQSFHLARRWDASLREMPRNAFLENATDGARHTLGSNVWVVSGKLTSSGYPILASDPHQGVAAPAHAYEADMTVTADSRKGPMRVYGVTYPGIPTVAMGCNERVCWGLTFAVVDQTDNYQEQVIFDTKTRLPTGTIFDGTVEPVALIGQTFRVKQITRGSLDNIAVAAVAPLAG